MKKLKWEQDLMNPEIKAEWVAALRSGQYKQGRNYLRDKDDNFCCLGVLCNIHAQKHPETASAEKHRLKYMGAVSFLPDAVCQWSGLRRSYGGMVTINKKFGDLAYHNDTGATFEEIADAIEKQL